MIPRNPLQTFKDLEAAKHIIKSDNTTTEYWWASDLYNILDITTQYPQTTLYDFAHLHFIKPIFNKNPNAHVQFERSYPTDNHTISQQHNYTLNKKTHYNTEDFQLSRYACWCICHANPNLIFQETYFLTSNTPNQQSFLKTIDTSIQFDRIATREKIKKHEKQLNGILKSCNIKYNKFYDELYCTLFGGHTLQNIRNSYKLPQKESVLNYMNYKTLQLFCNAISSIIFKYNSSHAPISLTTLTHNEIKAARINGIKIGCFPECCILDTHIKTIQKQYNNTIKKFAHDFYNTNTL